MRLDPLIVDFDRFPCTLYSNFQFTRIEREHRNRVMRIGRSAILACQLAHHLVGMAGVFPGQHRDEPQKLLVYRFIAFLE